MKKFGLILVLLAAIVPQLFSLSVDEDEVKKQNEIRFINSRNNRGSDSLAAIKGIGRNLASTGKSGDGYSLIQARGAGDDKFDADIIVIKKNARVNHIKNIRRIVAAYLEAKYQYSADEAKSLALFVTYYNGFYRKKLDYFQQEYKSEVLKHLTKNNAGLDLNYRGWPGKSRIVIPLSADEKPDAGKIGDKDVMDKVRKEEQGTKDRENITKIQESELKKKEDRIVQQKQRINQRREEISKKEDTIREEKKKNENNPDPTDKAKKDDEIKKKEEEIKKEKDDVKKDEQKIAQEEKKVEEKKAEVAQNKQNIQADNTQAQRKNETPAQREARLDAKEAALKNNKPQDSIFDGKLYYLRVRDFSTDGKYRNDFYIIDPKNRKIRVKSPYPGIVGKKFDVVDKNVVVIGEKKTATTVQHYLVLLDGETLVDKVYGSDEVFWRGFVEVRENEIYAVLNKNGTFYLGKFDKNLKLLQRSDVALHEDTFFSFYEDTIYVNGADRKIEVLNRADLKAVGNIIP